MAYDTKELFDRALLEIARKRLVFHDDVFTMLGISVSTYYAHFPKESKEYKEIESRLNANKIVLKSGIRNKWYNSKTDLGGLYLYKLICTPEEREALSTQYNKNEVSGHLDGIVTIDVSQIKDVNVLKELRKLAVAQQQLSEDAGNE